jgi:XTP/dITP diphosphohydrolase
VKLYCATTNRGKLGEFRIAADRFGRRRFQVAPRPGLAGTPPFEETGASFEENAIQKAAYYSTGASGLLFADDSGLEVRALGGAPGVSSARFAGPGASDVANNCLLVEKLRGAEDRAAQFVSVIALAERGRLVATFRSVIALAERGRLVATFRGVVEGQVLEEPRGDRGFGYDPLFFYPPLGRSFGEISAEQKLEVSHRGRALAAMLKYLIHRRTR